MQTAMKSKHLVSAKKSLGQNFCIDERIPEEVVRRLSAGPQDQIWEIGPGMGALTERLQQTGADLQLFEIDQRMQPILTQKFPEAQIAWGDFLEIDQDQLPQVNKPLLVCGNLPYYCGTPIIRRFLEKGPKPERMVFLLQEEVALKAAASENQPDYGFLSVLVAFFAKAWVGSTFPPSSFEPRPKINSTILVIEPVELTQAEKVTRLQALKMISVIFSQRRKMALSLLKKRFSEVNWAQRFEMLGIDAKARPENISPQTLLKLFSL